MLQLQSELTPVGTVWIPHEALVEMCREADAFSPRETGGVLMGYWGESPRAVVITHVIGAGKNAVHEATRFKPDYEFQEREVARRYLESNGASTYLGDWHTHPGSAGHLSDTDFLTLRRIATSRGARAPQPVMIILAWGTPWEPIACRGRLTGDEWRRKFVVEPWTIAKYADS